MQMGPGGTVVGAAEWMQREESGLGLVGALGGAVRGGSLVVFGPFSS